MPQDAYVSDSLVESIEAIQDLLDIPTFREASEVYDRMARKGKIGTIVKKHRREQGMRTTQPDAPDDFLQAAEDELARMEEEMGMR